MEEHRPKALLDQVRDAMRLKHCSYRTEQAYVGWIERCIYYHDVRQPPEMGAAEVGAFLTHLAVKGRLQLRHRTRPSVPCSFSIARCSKIWVLLTPNAPSAPSDCQLF